MIQIESHHFRTAGRAGSRLLVLVARLNGAMKIGHRILGSGNGKEQFFDPRLVVEPEAIVRGNLNFLECFDAIALIGHFRRRHQRLPVAVRPVVKHIEETGTIRFHLQLDTVPGMENIAVGSIHRSRVGYFNQRVAQAQIPV